MQSNRTLLEEMKFQYKTGGMHVRLIFINTVLFLILGISLVVHKLVGNQDPTFIHFLHDNFSLQTKLELFFSQPWGLILSIFTHFSFIHFALNMLFLFTAGQMFLQFFSSKRLLHVYVVGGIGGGVLELLAHSLFNLNGGMNTYVVGASGAIMAIFIALAFYRPQLRVNLFGMFSMPFFVLAGIMLVSNLVSLGANDGTAHFAHIGGAIVGMLSVRNLNSKTNLINMTEGWAAAFVKWWKGLFSSSPKMKVQKGGRVGKTDEEYNLEKKQRQQKTDVILDKISKSGYESLTKAEKEFLFSQSKNG